MAQAVQILVASVALAAVVWALWSIADRLMRRGIIVRPVSLMDAKMTEIERRYAEQSVPKDETAKE